MLIIRFENDTLLSLPDLLAHYVPISDIVYSLKVTKF